jgi:hypothetical protein
VDATKEGATGSGLKDGKMVFVKRRKLQPFRPAPSLLAEKVETLKRELEVAIFQAWPEI